MGHSLPPWRWDSGPSVGMHRSEQPTLHRRPGQSCVRSLAEAGVWPQPRGKGSRSCSSCSPGLCSWLPPDPPNPQGQGNQGPHYEGALPAAQMPSLALPRLAWWDGGSGAGSITAGQMSPARANFCGNQPQSSRSFLVAEESWSSRTRSSRWRHLCSSGMEGAESHVVALRLVDAPLPAQLRSL